ncbi:hypothetical protein BC830DRAFT_767163 [Chytriomyces sp. MP71]|nr:hypothetical protein BC830DRAFT_767163 [Chytriomyces sp. MP71]
MMAISEELEPPPRDVATVRAATPERDRIKRITARMESLLALIKTSSDASLDILSGVEALTLTPDAGSGAETGSELNDMVTEAGLDHGPGRRESVAQTDTKYDACNLTNNGDYRPVELVPLLRIHSHLQPHIQTPETVTAIERVYEPVSSPRHRHRSESDTTLHTLHTCTSTSKHAREFSSNIPPSTLAPSISPPRPPSSIAPTASSRSLSRPTRHRRHPSHHHIHIPDPIPAAPRHRRSRHSVSAHAVPREDPVEPAFLMIGRPPSFVSSRGSRRRRVLRRTEVRVCLEDERAREVLLRGFECGLEEGPSSSRVATWSWTWQGTGSGWRRGDVFVKKGKGVGVWVGRTQQQGWWRILESCWPWLGRKGDLVEDDEDPPPLALDVVAKDVSRDSLPALPSSEEGSVEEDSLTTPSLQKPLNALLHRVSVPTLQWSLASTSDALGGAESRGSETPSPPAGSPVSVSLALEESSAAAKLDYSESLSESEKRKEVLKWLLHPDVAVGWEGKRRVRSSAGGVGVF